MTDLIRLHGQMAGQRAVLANIVSALRDVLPEHEWRRLTGGSSLSLDTDPDWDQASQHAFHDAAGEEMSEIARLAGI